MKPIIFAKEAAEFNSRGLGTLTDAISCEVTEERNGTYELQLTYPDNGQHVAEIKNDNIIKAKPNEKGNPQPFRIYRVTKPMNGQITAYAEHISYQQNYIPVEPFEATGPQAALTGLKDHAAVACPFTVYTDIMSESVYSQIIPASFRSRLAGVEGSILDIFGGEYEFDVWRVNLWAARGADNGVTIRYGKNLIDIKQEESIQSVITGVYPYWTNGETTVELAEKVITIEHAYSYGRYIALDLSDEFEEEPTEEELRTAAQEYIQTEGIAEPDVSIKVDFIHLYQTVGYEDIAPLENVGLCDIITVHFEKLGINVKSKIVSYKYDVLAERYTEMQIGTLRSNLTSSVNEIKKEQLTTEQVMSTAKEATKLIIGNKGGYVLTKDADEDGHDDEILIMDALTTADAVKVWRWNKSGFGYSQTGYNGTYGTAITMDGQIVADFITTGTLDAAIINVTNITATNITSGILQSANYHYTSGYFSDAGTAMNLATGSIRAQKFAIDINGNAYFAGTLSAAGGTFTGALVAASGTFSSLRTIDGATGYGMQLFWSSIKFTRDNGSTWSGQIDVDAAYGVRIFSPNKVAIIGQETGYNMQFWVPGTNELSLTPMTTGTCNVGTNAYYFDYMHANHFTSHSLQKDKKNILGLKESDYAFTDLRPVLYEEKRSDSGKQYLGFIAEELEKSCQYGVVYDKDTGELAGIDYSRIVVVLVKELQLAERRIEELERKCA